ncbi:MAG TPA: DUF2905 domain-containing protein [Bryobacteraceae bacterium]|nr:DUF2905 domain-containing protein [Bryobacteraceae bacterium]
MGRSLLIFGLILAGAGLLMMFGDRLPFRLGHLPGDLVWKRKNTTFYFPLMTGLLLSALLTVLSWLFSRR